MGRDPIAREEALNGKPESAFLRFAWGAAKEELGTPAAVLFMGRLAIRRSAWLKNSLVENALVAMLRFTARPQRAIAAEPRLNPMEAHGQRSQKSMTH